MASGASNATIEGFVTDLAFTDQTKNTSDLFPSSTANVAELSSNALSYFSTPTAIIDKRTPTDRAVNWAAQTRPRIVVDHDVFDTFTATIAALPLASLNQLFSIVDKVLFNYLPTDTPAGLETFLTSNVSTKDVYVAGSLSVSTRIVTDNVYVDGAAPKQISVPAFVAFDVLVPSGSTTKTYSLKLYASISAWLSGYSQSVIAEVIPPLPYEKLLNESIHTATDNIFSTATLSATLSFNTVEARLKSTVVSGMFEFRAVLQDSSNTVGVPFNILYKGRVPTLFEIRNAVKQKLLNSGVGDETAWKKRIPGVFVSGRFYVVPFWDNTYAKPDQLLFPNVIGFNDMSSITSQILSTLGYSDVRDYMDIISIYYNHMTASVIPDLSGSFTVKRLSDIVPDYQSYSASDEQFGYMQDTTKAFVRDLNTVLSIASSTTPVSAVYGPNTEGALSFYSYTAGNYEICVITKSCYQAILESVQ